MNSFLQTCRAETWDVGEWQQGGWKYIRVREDKNLANDVSVIERIQKSRADNIKAEQVPPPPLSLFEES